ncbi:MAG: PH domain-containing protein [Pseudoxanthomonas sp.]
MQDAAPVDNETERRLHPWSWLFVLVQQLKQFIVPLLALLVFGGGGAGGFWAGIGPLVAVGVLVAISLLQYFTYRYRIGRDGLSIRDGLLHRNLRDIPYSRIHNVVLHQSLLHRLFGVAEVRLESAGGQKPEAQMRVLRLDQALALEDLIKHRGQLPDAGAPASVVDNLLSLPSAEVVRLGLVSNRGMVVVAAAFGGAWQLFPDRVVANFFETTGREFFGYASHLQLGWMTTAAAVIAMVLLAIVLLRLLSVALALIQYHGFLLSEEHKRLTVERGLLAKLRTSVARRRIQSWTLHEGFLHRLLKRRSLQVDTAVAEMGKSDHRAFREVAPIATPEACDALVRHLLPHAQWPRGAWTALAAGTWWRLFLPMAILCVLLAVGLLLRFTDAWALLPLLWLPWGFHASRQRARREGYAVDERLVVVRSGWWSRYWRFAEIDKLQALRLTRSPLDRRCGTASLWLDTAGASALAPALRIRFLPEAEARALYAQLGHALARQRLRW